MNRKDFCLKQNKEYPFSPEILSSLPFYVSIGKGVHISKNVTFSPFGFGYELIEDAYTLINHAGNIILGDNVYIHEFATIIRATSKDGVTYIGSGTKIDTFVHIAHNAHIGNNCLIISGSVVGGSSVIGNNCYLGMGSLIKNKIKIGNNVIIGMGAVVLKDVPDGWTMIGNPAKRLQKVKAT